MGVNGFASRHVQWMRRGMLVTAGVVMAVAALFTVNVANADVTIGGARNCDANAVIYCGAGSATELATKYNNGDGRNSAASIHNIFSWYGISASAVDSMPATAVAGSVTSSGNVYVGSQLVATGAVTGGRQYIAGSTQVNSGGTVFYARPPSVSFLSSSLPAYVVMSGGRFQFAVIASCGNAVKATPTAPAPAPTPPPAPKPPAPKPPAPAPTAPNYTIQKMVAAHGSSNFGSEIQVPPNTNVDYKVVITSTGTADVTNLVVNDTLPNDVTFTAGTLMRDGQAVSGTDASSFFGGGLTIGTLAHGTSTTFTFEALAGANQNNDNCNPETLPNVSHMTATNLPPENATATVSIVCAPKAAPAVIVTPPAPPAPAPTPAPAPAPTVLPSTGAGSVAGIFTGVSVAGAAGYQLFTRRRLTR